MSKLERKTRRLSKPKKAEAYQFYAEILELEFLKQMSEDPKKANITLIKKSIEKWERFKKISGNEDTSEADKKLVELKALKARVELQHP